jgi:hypothetical protein
METTINISDYLSREEIKSIVEDQVRSSVKNLLENEKNAERILMNLSYKFVFDEIDKVIPDSRGLIVNKTKEVINKIESYDVFRDPSYGGKKSLAYEFMEQAVKDNVGLLNDKVKETITSKDYSEEIWRKFEDLSDSFCSNIYEIVRLGRERK